MLRRFQAASCLLTLPPRSFQLEGNTTMLRTRRERTPMTQDEEDYDEQREPRLQPPIHEEPSAPESPLKGFGWSIFWCCLLVVLLGTFLLPSVRHIPEAAPRMKRTNALKQIGL